MNTIESHGSKALIIEFGVAVFISFSGFYGISLCIRQIKFLYQFWSNIQNWMSGKWLQNSELYVYLEQGIFFFDM